MKSFRASALNPSHVNSTLWDDIAVVAPAVMAGSLVVGILFYSFFNDWDFALSYYYAATVLLGDMYLTPVEPNPWSSVFTLFYFLWGTTLLAGAITAAANMVVNSALRIAAEERKRIFASTTGLEEDDGIYAEEGKSFFVGGLAHLISYLQWHKYRSKYLALGCAVGWWCLGVCYGLFYEGWSSGQSSMFALAAMSTAGNFPPPCIGADAVHCTLGTFRALFIGTYLVIGVPIFAYTVAQFAEILVERAIRANEEKLMCRPLTEHEFRLAYELHRGEIVVDSDSDDVSNDDLIEGDEEDENDEDDDVDSGEMEDDFDNSEFEKQNTTTDTDYFSLRQAYTRQQKHRRATRRQKSGTYPNNAANRKRRRKKPVRPQALRLDLEDFIILELLRLQKITMHDLHYMRELFNALDEDGDGVLLHVPDLDQQLQATAVAEEAAEAAAITATSMLESTPSRNSASRSSSRRHSPLPHYGALSPITGSPSSVSSTPVPLRSGSGTSTAAALMQEPSFEVTPLLQRQRSRDSDTSTVRDSPLLEQMQQQQQQVTTQTSDQSPGSQYNLTPPARDMLLASPSADSVDDLAAQAGGGVVSASSGAAGEEGEDANAPNLLRAISTTYNNLILSRLRELREKRSQQQQHPRTRSKSNADVEDEETGGARPTTSSSSTAASAASTALGVAGRIASLLTKRPTDDINTLPSRATRAATLTGAGSGASVRARATSAAQAMRNSRTSTLQNPSGVIQLRSFRKQPAGKRRLSRSDAVPLSEALDAADAAAGEGADPVSQVGQTQTLGRLAQTAALRTVAVESPALADHNSFFYQRSSVFSPLAGPGATGQSTATSSGNASVLATPERHRFFDALQPPEAVSASEQAPLLGNADEEEKK